MRFWRRSGDRISGTVRGSTVQGPVSIGKDIRVRQEAGDLSTRLSDMERADLSKALDDLRAEITANATDEQRAQALGHVDELEQAIAAPEADVTTIGRVLRWFRRHLPQVAGGVMSVVVHPVVGKLVASAGDAAVAELEDVLRRDP